eukprot:g3424.t1
MMIRNTISKQIRRQRRSVSGFANWDFSWVRNEKVKPYAPESADRANLRKEVDALYSESDIEIPCVINGKDVYTGNTGEQVMPTEHGHRVCTFHNADDKTVQMAIEAAMSPAAREWAMWPFEDRAAVFLKVADLCAGKYREKLNASIMIGTGKTPREADIDNTEISDFFRFGVKNAATIYSMQPPSLYLAQDYWNRMEHRPLDGFVFAVAPFNFCALGANLSGIPALMGNTVLFKPSLTAAHESWMMMKIFKEAGLPDGVINFIPCDGPDASRLVLPHRDLGGVNFTGSTGTFHKIWKGVAEHIDTYKAYPRVSGETGGKNFHFIHESADVETAVNQTIRGAYDYQGQKCSATSRLYVPSSLWSDGGFRDRLVEGTKALKMGCSTDFGSFLTAVIDRTSFDRTTSYLDSAKTSSDCEILCGGNYDDSKGYFIEPTIIVTKNPKYETMCNELFAPVLTVHVYDAKDYEETLQMCSDTSEYALTGSIFARDRTAIRIADQYLSRAAGNYYVNDKCTGAAVGEQPFGGSRKSGTNDKTGTILNNLRWTSSRTIKESFAPLSSPLWPCNSDSP